MIFSFTGAQSTGKTTLLKKLVQKNGSYPFEFVPEVTRLVMRDYGVAINEGGDDITQMLIMTEHIRNVYGGRADRLVRSIHQIYVIFYTSPKDVKLVDDGERSIDIHFRKDIISLFNMYMDSYKGKIVVLEGPVEERLQTIKETLEYYNIDIKI